MRANRPPNLSVNTDAPCAWLRPRRVAGYLRSLGRVKMRREHSPLIAGNARIIVVALVAALGFGVKIAWEAYDSGARDLGYIFFMSLAAVIALAIVAPRRF